MSQGPWLRSLVVFTSLLVTSQPAAIGDDAATTPKRWFKGNLHTHTLWSDGDGFPEMVADWYRRAGYHFLALSDHNVLSRGQKWLKESEVTRRAGSTAIPRYLARFGPSWVERRGHDERRAIRLKPLSEVRCLVEERGRFLMIEAEEISDRFGRLPVHMNAINLGELVQPQGGDSVRAVIERNLAAVKARAKELGAEVLVHLNHPNFGYAVTAEDIAGAVTERFYEVFNGHPGVGHRGDADHPSVERLWDIANTLRIGSFNAPPLYGLATDDSHRYHRAPGDHSGSQPGRGWVQLRARHLTPESLIRALKAGEFYASTGVTLSSVRFEESERTLALDIVPDGAATFTTRFIGTRRGAPLSGTPRRDSEGRERRVTKRYAQSIGAVLAEVTGLEPRYQLTGDELYVRAVVTSSKAVSSPSFEGQKAEAWSQPVGWRLEPERRR